MLKDLLTFTKISLDKAFKWTICHLYKSTFKLFIKYGNY